MGALTTNIWYSISIYNQILQWEIKFQTNCDCLWEAIFCLESWDYLNWSCSKTSLQLSDWSGKITRLETNQWERVAPGVMSCLMRMHCGGGQQAVPVVACTLYLIATRCSGKCVHVGSFTAKYLYLLYLWTVAQNGRFRTLELSPTPTSSQPTPPDLSPPSLLWADRCTLIFV